MDLTGSRLDNLRCDVGCGNDGFNEQQGGIGMKFGAIFASVFLMAACTSMEVRDAHMQNQIRMVQVQKEADSKLAIAEANAKVALYEALADVARSNPSQASAVVVAMAIQGIGKESEAGDTRIVPLQPLQNEGLEYAKTFAGPAMNVLSGVGIAAINANVARTQSDNAARVQINDAQTDASIVEAVASLGQTAASATGLMVSGDYLQVTDQGVLTQDLSTTTTATTTSTETVSTITDSYNSETVTYAGEGMTLESLLSFLQGTGKAYELTLGSTVYTVDGDGDPTTIDCSALDFSPPLPECV